MMIAAALAFIHGGLNAQGNKPLGRVTFSSGGSSASNQLPASMGEVFVGGKGNGFTMGSQQNWDMVDNTTNRYFDLKAILYPNPTSGLLRVSISKMPTYKGRVAIFSLLGQELKRQDFEGLDVEINTVSLQAGMYYLKLYSLDGMPLKTFPFIKQ